MTTRSKLNNVYPTATIHAMDKQAHATLKELRALPSNKECAECTASPSTWASVSLGVFVCMDCAQVHRNLGAHLSKVKSCMGTYLWCPDELERMREIGNARALALHTGGAPRGTDLSKPAAGSPFEVRDRYARAKYEAKGWMHPGGMAAVLAEEQRRPAAPVAKARPAPRVASRGNPQARASARSKVQAMRRGRPDGGATAADVEAAGLLDAPPAVDDDGWGGEWDTWSPRPRGGQNQTARTAVAAPPPAAFAAPPPVLATPAVTGESPFDAFFRECTGGSSVGGAVSQPQHQQQGGTELIDLFAPSPAVTTGLLSRQLSAH